MKKIVINNKYGGFSISQEAYERLIELGVPVQRYYKQERDPETLRYKEEPLNAGEVIFDTALIPEEERDEIDRMHLENSLLGRYWDTWIDKNREHPLLIQVVEELGGKANGSYAKLKIVEIPDDVEYEIEEYDGIEWVAEKHRTWR